MITRWIGGWKPRSLCEGVGSLAEVVGASKRAASRALISANASSHEVPSKYVKTSTWQSETSTPNLAPPGHPIRNVRSNTCNSACSSSFNFHHSYQPPPPASDFSTFYPNGSQVRGGFRYAFSIFESRYASCSRCMDAEGVRKHLEHQSHEKSREMPNWVHLL